MTQHAKLQYEFKDDLEWIRVVDQFPANHRYLHFEDTIQGVLSLLDHHVPVLEYIGLMCYAAKTLQPQPARILIGGLGCCAILHQVTSWWKKEARILSIESNERVYDLARQYFRLAATDKVIVGDLRDKLEDDTHDKTDICFIDCYSATSIPPHLTTLEFMYLVHQRLACDGCAVFNLWNPSCNEMCGDQIRTIMEVFGHAALLTCREDDNIVVMALKTKRPDWPIKIHFKGLKYAVLQLDVRFPGSWPDYMKDSDIIRDDNLADFFDAVGIVF